MYREGQKFRDPIVLGGGINVCVYGIHQKEIWNTSGVDWLLLVGFSQETDFVILYGSAYSLVHGDLTIRQSIVVMAGFQFQLPCGRSSHGAVVSWHAVGASPAGLFHTRLVQSVIHVDWTDG